MKCHEIIKYVIKILFLYENEVIYHVRDKKSLLSETHDVLAEVEAGELIDGEKVLESASPLTLS